MTGQQLFSQNKKEGVGGGRKWGMGEGLCIEFLEKAHKVKFVYLINPTL